MRPSAKAFLAAGSALLVAGMAASLFREQPSAPLPRVPASTKNTDAFKAPEFTASQFLGPWEAPPRVVTPAPVKEAPVRPPTPLPDRTSVRFVGVLTGDHDVVTHLFKFLPTGRVLTLVLGEEKDGWTLELASPKMFTLKGPGGFYEIPR